VNILAVFAHPDDETMLAGGILALASQSGMQVDYVCATRGEGGEVGEPPVCTRETLGEVREQEMVCAVQTLGGHSLTFLGYTDPPVSEKDELFAFTDNLTMLAGQIAASIKQFESQIVLTHGSNGEYGHPAHLVTYQAVRMAVESLLGTEEGLVQPILYTVQASFEDNPKPHLVNRDDPAHLVLDISSVLDIKTRAALCHKSQNALFVRRASQRAGRPMTIPEVIVSLESLHRASPAWQGGPEDEFARQMRRWQKANG
jgi:N-acetylglucosamine malate deacetylase 2